MNIVEAFILGVVQGITEWLPISSSGHLMLAQKVLELEVPLLFDIFLHVASLLVIFVIFWKEILDLIKAIIHLNFKSDKGKMALFIIIGSIPTAIIGYLFNNLFREAFNSIVAVCFGLSITVFFLISSRLGKGVKKLKWYNSLIIGISQGLAILPGVSRSGSTISTALLMDIDRSIAFKFSFLLAIPAIIGAIVNDFTMVGFYNLPIFSLFISMVTTFIVGFFSLKYLIKFVLNDKFHYFAYYCLILILILLFLFF